MKATAQPRFSPAQLATALGLHTPTDEQAAVIASPPGPLVVSAGAGAIRDVPLDGGASTPRLVCSPAWGNTHLCRVVRDDR